MINFSTPLRSQQVLTPLGSEQTTSLLVVLIFGNEKLYAQPQRPPGALARENRKITRFAGGESTGICAAVLSWQPEGRLSYHTAAAGPGPVLMAESFSAIIYPLTATGTGLKRLYRGRVHCTGRCPRDGIELCA